MHVDVLGCGVVLDHDGTQLPVELEEYLALPGKVQIAADGQRLDVQRLASLELHREFFGDLGSGEEVASAQLVYGTELLSEVLRKNTSESFSRKTTKRQRKTHLEFVEHLGIERGGDDVMVTQLRPVLRFQFCPQGVIVKRGHVRPRPARVERRLAAKDTRAKGLGVAPWGVAEEAL